MIKKMRDKDSPTFKEATANMTGKEKRNYIWEYYKLHIIGTIAAVLLVGSMTHSILTQVDSYLHITFMTGFEHLLSSFDLDSDVDPEQELFFPEPPPGIWVDFDIAPVLEDLLLDESQQRNYEIVIQTLAIDFETIPVFTTHTGAGLLDMIITHIPDLHSMTEIGHFKNITDLGWDLPEHVMHNEYAVYLRYFPVFDGYVIPIDELVLGISSTTRHIENIEAFFETLLD